MDPSDYLKTNNWVHHQPNILSQGRCTFFRVRHGRDGEDSEDEEKDEEAAEEGPRLLSSIAEDTCKWWILKSLLYDGNAFSAAIGSFEAWTSRISSSVNSKYGHAILRSNRWPGAYAFAKDDRFANIYVGFGTKQQEEPYFPPLPSMPQTEAVAPQEMVDPTVEEEEKNQQGQTYISEFALIHILLQMQEQTAQKAVQKVDHKTKSCRKTMKRKRKTRRTVCL